MSLICVLIWQHYLLDALILQHSHPFQESEEEEVHDGHGFRRKKVVVAAATAAAAALVGQTIFSLGFG